MFSKKLISVIILASTICAAGFYFHYKKEIDKKRCLAQFNVKYFEGKIEKIKIDTPNYYEKDNILDETFKNIQSIKSTMDFGDLFKDKYGTELIDESVMYYSAYKNDYLSGRRKIAIDSKLNLVKSEISELRKYCDS